MKIKTFLVFALFSLFILTSCATLVYSPSLNLPDKIQKDETTIIAAYESLPSTEYDEENGAFIAIQHSFSNKFCTQFKYWADFKLYGTNKYYLHGASLTSYLLLNDTNSEYKLYFAPTLGLSLMDKEFDLGTIGATFAVQTPNFWILKPYAGVGVMYGSENLQKSNYWGLGILSNVGSNVDIYKNLKLKIELSFPLVYDQYKKEWTFFYLIPNIGFSYRI